MRARGWLTRGYWRRLTEARIRRRRALNRGRRRTASARCALSCGRLAAARTRTPGAREKGARTSVAKPVDSTSKAKAGGVLKHWATGDPAHLDPLLSSNANVVNFVSPYAYPRLMKWASGTYPKSADGSMEGYAAESYEISPDKLQITFKLRQG